MIMHNKHIVTERLAQWNNTLRNPEALTEIKTKKLERKLKKLLVVRKIELALTPINLIRGRAEPPMRTTTSER